jgi:hypothetical protein
MKGYGKFDNNARPDGWNIWMTFALPPVAQSSPPSMLARRRAAKATEL